MRATSACLEVAQKPPRLWQAHLNTSYTALRTRHGVEPAVPANATHLLI